MEKKFLKQWDYLTKRADFQQLSHAYLFSGLVGESKELFAKEFIKYINCLDKKKPCQKCIHCKLLEQESFPDLKVVKAEEEKEEIEISQIREVQNFLKFKPYMGLMKTVLIKEAELMNNEAQSCFLKTLEEPKGKTLIILLVTNIEILLPTIVSRCQVIKFFKKEDDLFQNKESNQRMKELVPILNSDLITKFNYVKSLGSEKGDIKKVIELIQRYLRKLLLLKLGVIPTSGKDEMLLKAGVGYETEKIFAILKLIDDINQKLFLYNINPKLALEIILMEL